MIDKIYCYSWSRRLPETGIMVTFFLLCLFSLNAQNINSGRSFEFVNIPNSAKQVGLGGINITSNDRDPTIFLTNPATNTKELDNFASFSYSPYFAQTNYLTSTYSKNFKNISNVGLGINYLNYGDFQGYDPAGTATGEFSANDYVVILSNSHIKDNFSFGINLKFVGSTISSYTSSALLFDVGGMFIHPKEDLKIGLAVSNVGLSLKKYHSNALFRMPLNVAIGGSFKPSYMPIRLSVTLNNLNNFALTSETERKVSSMTQLFSHFVVGSEIIVSKNINLRAGYNFLRRRELKEEQTGKLTGFSLGGMVRTKRFEISYGRGFFNKAGAQNCFSLILDLNTFLKKASPDS